MLFFVLMEQKASAQLGFCNGNSGDPIFTETFGTGLTDGPPLPPGVTTYNYVDRSPTEPVDGNYTISSTTNTFDWFDVPDHTPGDVNGKAFIVNASFEADTFFRRSIDGLCENTSYEFSAWVLNLLPSSTQCPNMGIPINVRFEILDSTGTQVLAIGDTGDIRSTSTPIWNQFGLVFTTQPGQTAVILRMSNNGDGGCGNDLAIDDIVFRTCGDAITVIDSNDTQSINICETEAPVSTTLVANPDFSVFQNHAYQWQTSPDAQNWTDILGANAQNFTTPAVNTNTFYRVNVAEDAINLGNTSCSVVSDVFAVNIVNQPDAPISNGDVMLCSDTLGGVRVTVPNDVVVNWYDAPTGGNLLASNTSFFETPVDGTFYAEAISSLASCFSDTRTPVSITYFDLPILEDESLCFCEGDTAILSANFPNATYLWDTGQTTPEIQVDIPGIYSVLVTNTNGCSAIKTITLDQIDQPIIQEIITDHRDITIITENQGDFEYSLNGLVYQQSPTFENLVGGPYIAFARGSSSCNPVSLPFIHIVIPRFFTPNGDGFNDTFNPEGVQLTEAFNITIFDRFGKLIFQSSNIGSSWDGTFNGTPLPSTDYWYNVQVGEANFQGHFALKR